MRALFLVPLLLASSCARPTPAPEPAVTPRGFPAFGLAATSAVLGPTGGSLTSSDGRLTMEVPPGALTEPRTLTLTPVINMAPGGLGVGYSAEPDGLQFSQPVRFVFATTAGDRARLEVGGMSVATQAPDGTWDRLETVREGNTVWAQNTHFSFDSLVGGALLSPPSEVVAVGTSLGLEVVTCSMPKDSKLYECDSELTPLAAVEQWAVDGVTGGNGTVGTVAGVEMTAIYTAPATRPRPPRVNVTVRYRDGAMTTLLYSHLAIGEGKELVGSFEMTSHQQVLGAMFSVKGDATLTVADEGPDETNYEMSGLVTMLTAVFQWGNLSCEVVEAQKPIEHQSDFKVLKDPLTAVRWSFNEGWEYECTDPSSGLKMPMLVVVSFSTTTGTNCTQFADVPIADLDNPKGQFTQGCTSGIVTAAKWDFQPSGN